MPPPPPVPPAGAIAGARGDWLALPAALGSQLAAHRERVWMRIGTLRGAMSDRDGALQAFERVLTYNPRNVKAMTQAGAALAKKEAYPQAIAFLRRAIAAEPTDGEAWAVLAHCYVMTDELHQAYQAYQSALSHLADPKDPNLWYGIGLLYDRYGSLENALEAFLAVLQIAPDFERAEEVCFCIGIIYKEQSRFDKSLEFFNKAVAAYSPPPPLTRADTWFQIGHVNELKKDNQAAMETYVRALTENPTHSKSLQALAWLRHQEGHSDEAVLLLQRSTRADSADGQSWYLLGRVHMSKKDFRLAYEAYQQAVYREHGNPTFWCSIGVLYYQMQQYRDAMDAYSRAIRINPEVSEVWYDLGTLYESCSQISDAVDAYRRAAELAPSNGQISQRLGILEQSLVSGIPPPAANTNPPQQPEQFATSGHHHNPHHPPPLDQQPHLKLQQPPQADGKQGDHPVQSLGPPPSAMQQGKSDQQQPIHGPHGQNSQLQSHMVGPSQSQHQGPSGHMGGPSSVQQGGAHMGHHSQQQMLHEMNPQSGHQQQHHQQQRHGSGGPRGMSLSGQPSALHQQQPSQSQSQQQHMALSSHHSSQMHQQQQQRPQQSMQPLHGMQSGAGQQQAGRSQYASQLPLPLPLPQQQSLASPAMRGPQTPNQQQQPSSYRSQPSQPQYPQQSGLAAPLTPQSGSQGPSGGSQHHAIPSLANVKDGGNSNGGGGMMHQIPRSQPAPSNLPSPSPPVQQQGLPGRQPMRLGWPSDTDRQQQPRMPPSQSFQNEQRQEREEWQDGHERQDRSGQDRQVQDRHDRLDRKDWQGRQERHDKQERPERHDRSERHDRHDQAAQSRSPQLHAQILPVGGRSPSLKPDRSSPRKDSAASKLGGNQGMPVLPPLSHPLKDQGPGRSSEQVDDARLPALPPLTNRVSDEDNTGNSASPGVGGGENATENATTDTERSPRRGHDASPPDSKRQSQRKPSSPSFQRRPTGSLAMLVDSATKQYCEIERPSKALNSGKKSRAAIGDKTPDRVAGKSPDAKRQKIDGDAGSSRKETMDVDEEESKDRGESKNDDDAHELADTEDEDEDDNKGISGESGESNFRSDKSKTEVTKASHLDTKKSIADDRESTPSRLVGKSPLTRPSLFSGDRVGRRGDLAKKENASSSDAKISNGDASGKDSSHRDSARMSEKKALTEDALSKLKKAGEVGSPKRKDVDSKGKGDSKDERSKSSDGRDENGTHGSSGVKVPSNPGLGKADGSGPAMPADSKAKKLDQVDSKAARLSGQDGAVPKKDSPSNRLGPKLPAMKTAEAKDSKSFKGRSTDEPVVFRSEAAPVAAFAGSAVVSKSAAISGVTPGSSCGAKQPLSPVAAGKSSGDGGDSGRGLKRPRAEEVPAGSSSDASIAKKPMTAKLPLPGLSLPGTGLSGLTGLRSAPAPLSTTTPKVPSRKDGTSPSALRSGSDQKDRESGSKVDVSRSNDPVKDERSRGSGGRDKSSRDPSDEDRNNISRRSSGSNWRDREHDRDRDRDREGHRDRDRSRDRDHSARGEREERDDAREQRDRDRDRIGRRDDRGNRDRDRRNSDPRRDRGRDRR